MKKTILIGISKSVVLSMLVVMLVIFPLTAAKCPDTPCFTDFYAYWSCDYDDVKLSVTTMATDDDIRGKIVLDGVETDLIFYFDRSEEVIVAFNADEVDTTKRKWEFETKTRVFIAQTDGHRKAVTFKIIYDYTGRPGQKSLLNRTLVLNRDDQ